MPRIVALRRLVWKGEVARCSTTFPTRRARRPSPHSHCCVTLSCESNSANAASSMERCCGFDASSSCCKILLRESSKPLRFWFSAICSAVRCLPRCCVDNMASSCCCSTDLLSHPRAIVKNVGIVVPGCPASAVQIKLYVAKSATAPGQRP
jgi:hypothetical protein